MGLVLLAVLNWVGIRESAQVSALIGATAFTGLLLLVAITAPLCLLILLIGTCVQLAANSIGRSLEIRKCFSLLEDERHSLEIARFSGRGILYRASDFLGFAMALERANPSEIAVLAASERCSAAEREKRNAPAFCH
jgi:hypothetical protein